MRFISVRDLSIKPKEVWQKVKEEEMVITSNGKPIALLSAGSILCSVSGCFIVSDKGSHSILKDAVKRHLCIYFRRRL